jgi:hypothetical protein
VNIVGVYRRRNAPHVRELLEPALDEGWATAWWALDGVDRSLERYTVGEGPGLKFPLVNEMLRAEPRAKWTIVSDDDITFRRGTVVTFVRSCRQAGLDLAQPSRARGNVPHHGITCVRPLVRARLTTFVESGPLFAVGPRFSDRLLPLPAALGMGWGVEFRWFDLTKEGCRLGIVDEAVVEHVGRVGAEYETAELEARVRAELVARGAESWQPFQQILGLWRPWRRRAPWLRHEEEFSRAA